MRALKEHYPTNVQGDLIALDIFFLPTLNSCDRNNR